MNYNREFYIISFQIQNNKWVSFLDDDMEEEAFASYKEAFDEMSNRYQQYQMAAKKYPQSYERYVNLNNYKIMKVIESRTEELARM